MSYTVGDRDHDGRPDLYVVVMNGTASGHTELHVLSGGSGFGSWIVHAATGLTPTTSSGWQFATA